MSDYQTIETQVEGSVGVITLNRPDALNALSAEMSAELNAALDGFENDDAIGAMVLTGSEKAFAAGADIKQMSSMHYLDTMERGFLGDWDRLTRCRKPLLAAVSGYALGGGCEIAMMCDTIYAADNAKFGQPEIQLGVIPGLGGTQRLTRLVGKAKAMDLVLTGRMMDATEAERAGLVARIFPQAELVEEVVKIAQTMAERSVAALRLAKDAVNLSLNTTLDQGAMWERQSFYSLFGTPDQREGMQAFIEKRAPEFDVKKR
jgi:enoyl-CoA hydratase